jgi:hypothetical protein
MIPPRYPRRYALCEPHFAGLRDYADDAVRQPDFAAVRRRAGRVRRRRAVASSAAAVATALVVSGLGYAAIAGPSGGPPAAPPTPSISEDPTAGWPRLTDVGATGPDDLYAVFERCRDCAPELYVSEDAGATWQRRTVPPAPSDATAGISRSSWLVPLGPGILAWRDLRTISLSDIGSLVAPSTEPTDGGRSPSAIERTWITVDGGRTWRRAEVDPDPMTAVPPGSRPVDCQLAGQPSPCQIYAVDPVSGRFAPLADQPSGITFESGWLAQTDVPLGGHLWVPGLDPATHKPAVASSPDGGRTWLTHVFVEGMPAVANDDGRIAAMYLPTVAAGADGTAYALTYREDLRMDPYRSTDGGVTWRPVPGGAVPEVPDAGFVTADGAHVVKTGWDFRASRDGGEYEPVTLPGYPADLLQLTQVTSQRAAGRYIVPSMSSFYVSDDGWTWRRVYVP